MACQTLISWLPLVDFIRSHHLEMLYPGAQASGIEDEQAVLECPWHPVGKDGTAERSKTAQRILTLLHEQLK